MAPTVYLVTGAARGIGFSLIQQLADKPNTIAYAGVRSYPPSADSPLGKLIAKHPKIVIPIKITSGDEQGNAAAAETIKAGAGKVDVVIANAGVNSGLNSILQLTPADLRSDFETNTIGTVVLFKAFAPLLSAANAAKPGSAKFVVISTRLAQITDAIPWTYNAYGASKAAVNFLVKKMDIESPHIAAFPIHPGLVETDMANEVKKGSDMENLKAAGAISPTQSAQGILSVIDKATKETHGGKFWDHKGIELSY